MKSKRHILGSAILGVSLLSSATLYAATPAAPATLCVNGKCASADGNWHKWHPGHYLLVYKNAPNQNFDKIFDQPNFLGAQARYQWKDLEPRKGVYDFSIIENQLNYLQAHNKRLIIEVRLNEVPTYLTTDPIYKGGKWATDGNWGGITRFWDAAVMDRIIALWQALGKRFDKEPYVEAVNTDGTATGFGSNVPPDYTADKDFEQRKRHLAAAIKAFPHTVVIRYIDYGAHVKDLMQYARDAGAGAGAPDIMPDGRNKIDSFKTGFAGQMPLGQAVQTPELCQSGTGRFLPEQIYRYGVDTLKLNYMFWIEQTTRCDTATKKYSFQYGIIPTVNKHQGAINTSCPDNIKPCKTN